MTILAPIQRHIDALAEPGFPTEAVEACLARPEASAPLLRALLQRAARGQPLSEPEANRLFVGLHILAKLRDTQSFVPLMRLLGRPLDNVEELLGDVVTATLGRVAASLFDGDADILFEMIADTALDEYIRDALWGAATTLVIQRRIDRERMRAFILRFEKEHLAPSGDVAWFGWLGAISYAGFADVAAGIGRFWSDGRLSRDIITLKEFHQNLAEALAAPDDPARLARVGLAPIDDIAQALSWVDWNGPPEPIINPMRGVGRNDPCPCGSGKKAKKCCLQLKS